MPSSLSSLPDLCLLTVFKYLSLLELLRTIRLVSTRWSSLLPTELNHRRSLVIVDDRTFDLSRLQLDRYGSRLIEHVRRDDALTPWARLPHIDHRNVINHNNRYPHEDDEEHHPLHNQIPPQMITTLMNTLPRINSLTVVQRFVDPSALIQITRMIDHYRNDLVSLKLYLNHEHAPFRNTGGQLPEDHIAQLSTRTLALFEWINRVASLKHLTLKLDNFCLLGPQFRPPLTILSQLSTFHSSSLVLQGYFGDALVRYASGNRDIQVSTNGCTFSMDFLLRIKPEFYNRLMSVELEGGREPRNLTIHGLDQFCTRFSSLVHLTVKHHDIPVTRLAQSLSQLIQLVHLSVNVSANPSYRLAENRPENQQELPLDQIIPVPSVRLLTLNLYIKCHKSTEQLHLPQLFPNVQVLSIESYNEGCWECKYSLHYGDKELPEIAPEMRKCAQLARRPFRDFASLHTVEIDANDSVYLSIGLNEKKLITIDEL